MSEVVDRLVVESAFDPSGLIRGIDVGAASLSEFEKIVRQVDKATNQALDVRTLAKQSANAIREMSAATAAYEQRVKAVLVASGHLSATPLGPVSPPIITRDKVAELKILASQLHESQIVVEQFTGSINRMNVALLSRSSGRIGDNGASFDRGLANIGGSAAAAESFTKSSRAANLMRGSLVTLAAQSLQTSSAIGGLAQSALLFAGGSTAVIGIAATVLAGSKAWDLYSQDQREAAKAAEDLTQRLKQLREEQKGPATRAQEDFDNQRVEVERLKKVLTELHAEQQKAARLQVGSGVEQSFAAQIRLRGEEAKAVGKVTEANRDLNAAQQALSAIRTDPLLDIARELAVMQTSEDAVRRLELVQLEASGAIVKGTVAIFDQKVALDHHIKALEDAKDAAEKFAAVQKAIAAAEGDAIRGAQKVADEITKGWNDAREAASDYAKNAQQGIDGLLTAEEIHLDFINKQRDAYNQVADAIFDVARRSSDIGLITHELANAVGAALDLSGAIKEISLTGAGLTNVLGVVGAGISVLGAIGGLFGGGGPDETDRLLAENNSRLADLKASLDKNINTLAGLNASAEQLRALRAVPGILPPTGRPFDQPFKQYEEALRKSLAAAGMTVEEWAARIERQTGIDVLNDEGRLLAEAMKQADVALKILIEDAERFAAEEAARVAAENLQHAADLAAEAMGKLAEQTRRAIEAQQAAIDQRNRELLAATPGLLGLRRQLTGTADDPQQIFKDALAGLTPITATSGLLESFMGFDLADQASRDALQQKVLDTVNQLISGKFPLEDQSQFAPLLEFLGIATDVLGGFTDSVTEATKSLMNVPTGVNMAAFEFQAQAALGAQAAAPQPFDQDLGFPRSPSQSLGDGRPFRGNDGASLPVSQITIHRVDITIPGGTTVTPEQAARQIKLELKKLSMATHGNPDQWADT